MGKIKSQTSRVATDFDRAIKNIQIEYLKDGKRPPTIIKITKKLSMLMRKGTKLHNELLKIR